jgi:hypothetical protein
MFKKGRMAPAVPSGSIGCKIALATISQRSTE